MPVDFGLGMCKYYVINFCPIVGHPPTVLTGYVPNSMLSILLSPGWSANIPRMVTQYTKDAQPLSKIWSSTLEKMVTHFTRDGHQLYPGWSNTFPNGHPPYKHPPTQGRPPTITRIFTYSPLLSQNSHLPSPGWSTSFGV